MVKIQLKYGKDAGIHQLAEDIIKAQEQEIKKTQYWLKNKQPQTNKP